MPLRRRYPPWRTPVVGSKAPRVGRRTRAKIRGRLKRRYRLSRREIGAIGAGHLEAPPGYEAEVAAALELARFRMILPVVVEIS